MIDTTERREYIKKIRKEPKQRIISQHGIHQLYEHYKANTIKDLIVPLKTFKAILGNYNTELINHILNAEEVRLGSRLGYLRIKKVKIEFKRSEGLKIDWKRTKETGNKIFHLNEHRNGYFYKFTWRKGVVPYIKAYSFIVSRHNKRRLPQILKNNKEIDYYE